MHLSNPAYLVRFLKKCNNVCYQRLLSYMERRRFVSVETGYYRHIGVYAD